MDKISENDNLFVFTYKGIKVFKTKLFYVDLYINQVKLLNQFNI